MRSLWLAWMVVWVVGCGSAAPVSDEVPVEVLDAGIWDVESGQLLTAEELEERAGAATVIIVGESHGTAFHHERQKELLERIEQGDGRTLGVGMEMIEARFQEVVDRYLAQEISEDEFLEGVQWESRWGVDMDYYAPVWRLARAQGLRLIALNAPRELVRAVGQEGVDGLGHEEREALPELDLEEARAQQYRQHLSRFLGAHGHGEVDEEALDRFFQAQMVWDSAMAQEALEALQEGLDAMYLVVGRGHMERGYGIPMVLQQRGLAPDEVLTIVPVSTSGDQASRMENYRDLEWLREESIADIVWVE